MKMKAIAALTAATFVITPACAQQITSIEIIDYGIYTASTENTQPGADDEFAYSTIDNIRHAVTTAMVPAQLGVRFGFHIHISGKPEKQKVALKRVWIFPAPGLKPPKSTAPVLRSEATLVWSIGQTRYTGYSFGEPWELVPGVWTVQLWQGERKFAEQSFTVTLH